MAPSPPRLSTERRTEGTASRHQRTSDRGPRSRSPRYSHQEPRIARSPRRRGRPLAREGREPRYEGSAARYREELPRAAHHSHNYSTRHDLDHQLRRSRSPPALYSSHHRDRSPPGHRDSWRSPSSERKSEVRRVSNRSTPQAARNWGSPRFVSARKGTPGSRALHVSTSLENTRPAERAQQESSSASNRKRQKEEHDYRGRSTRPEHHQRTRARSPRSGVPRPFGGLPSHDRKRLESPPNHLNRLSSRSEPRPRYSPPFQHPQNSRRGPDSRRSSRSPPPSGRRRLSRDLDDRLPRDIQREDMYPHHSGGYHPPPPQHSRLFPPPPIDTRFGQSPPHGVMPSPRQGHHGYPARSGYQTQSQTPHSWSPPPHQSEYPPHHAESRSYNSSGPSPSPNYVPSGQPHSAHPSPSPNPGRTPHSYSAQMSPPGPPSHASPTNSHHDAASQSGRGGGRPPGRGGFGQRSASLSGPSQSPSTPAGRGGANVRGSAHFSNLTWKPGVGTRGGQAPKALFQTQNRGTNATAASPTTTTTPPITKNEAVAPPSDPTDPNNPFRVPEAADVEKKSLKTDSDAITRENLFRVPDDSQPSRRNGTQASEAPSNVAKSSEGPKISFNMKKPTNSAAAVTPRRDLLQAKVPLARSGPPRQAQAEVRNTRYDERDRLRDRDRFHEDRRRDLRGGPYDRERDRERDRDPRERDRNRDRHELARHERDVKPVSAKPKAPPAPLPDLLSSGRRAKYNIVPPTIPVKVSADTPVWLIRQLLDGALQNHRKRPRLPPSEWIKENPPAAQLPEEHKVAKSQYPKQEDSVVGAGTYGQVYKTINVYKPKQGAVALKRVAMASENNNNGFPFTSVRELSTLVAIKDLRIPQYFESMVERVVGNTADKVDLWYYMVFEYVPYDLAGILNHPTVRLELAHRKELAKQMYDGLVWLHSVGILHRDIKAGNILVDHNCVLKLTDFGLAKRYDLKTGPWGKHTNRIVTIWYRCPELLLGDNYYGTEPDFWAAACVLGEILLENGNALFPGPGTDIMQLDYMWSILGKPTKEEWPEMATKPWYNLLLLDDQYSRKVRDAGGTAKRYVRKFEERYRDKFTPAAMDLLQSALQWDPKKRPDGHTVLAHRFFTEEEPKPQRFEKLGDALGGDFHEFDYKKHRDAARAERNAAQKLEREQRKKDEALARQEKKRGAVDDGIAEFVGSSSAVKRARKDPGAAGSTSTALESASTFETPTLTIPAPANEDQIAVEASMEPGAPKDPADDVAVPTDSAATRRNPVTSVAAGVSDSAMDVDAPPSA